MFDLKYEQKFKTYYIYRTQKQYIFICCLSFKRSTTLMTISRLSKALDIKIAKRTYDFKEALIEVKKSILSEYPDENHQKSSYILSKFFVAKAKGIIGFPKFLDGYYIFFVSKKKKVSEFFGTNIYKVEEAKLEILLTDSESCLYNFSTIKSSEIKYLDYFNAVDQNSLYFCYELDLSNSI